MSVNRRQFIRQTSGGILVSGLATTSLALANPLTPPRPIRFKPYRPGHTLGQVLQVTPEDGGSFANTYYDVNPWSPSGRYLALTRFPFQDRVARLGDIADVVVVDLHEHTLRTVYRTRCWGFQMGAILNWGADDALLYTNDVLNEGRSVGIRIDLASGETLAFAGPKYDLDPSDERAIGPELDYLNLTQYAYGPPAADPENLQHPDPTKKAISGVWEMLSDCYPFEPMATDSGEIPIRLIDLRSDTEESICHIFTDLGRSIKIPRKYGPAKLDAHPVWSSDGKQVCFNGAPEGTRQVFIADLDGFI